VNPRNEPAPYIEEAGTYGSGLAHEADVELIEFEAPDENGKLERMPAYDREGKNNVYFRFNFKLVLANGQTRFLTHWATPRTLRQCLVDCGVEVTDNPDGDFDFEAGSVAPTKIGGLDIGPPRAGKFPKSHPQAGEPNGRWYTGDLNGIVAR
jgi:hypothetical protein